MKVTIVIETHGAECGHTAMTAVNIDLNKNNNFVANLNDSIRYPYMKM